MADISLKQGAALALQIAAYDDQGVAFDITGMTYRAQVRDAQNDLVAALPMVPGAAANLISIFVPSTQAWPLGLLRGDIRFTANGADVISDTFTIHMLAAATQ